MKQRILTAAVMLAVFIPILIFSHLVVYPLAMAILAAIEEGIRQTGKLYTVIENRREAIRHAMDIAQEGDIIVLAGKGHETYQEIQGVKYPFDEKIVVQELLAEIRAGK